MGWRSTCKARHAWQPLDTWTAAGSCAQGCPSIAGAWCTEMAMDLMSRLHEWVTNSHLARLERMNQMTGVQMGRRGVGRKMRGRAASALPIKLKQWGGPPGHTGRMSSGDGVTKPGVD